MSALEVWGKHIVLIENDWREKGTGFFIKPILQAPSGVRFFLITNKHVLNNDPRLRADATEITLYPALPHSEESDVRTPWSVSLRYENGERNWRGHPDPDVDVLAIDLTMHASLDRGAHGFDAFAPNNLVQVGDKVAMIGFPEMGRPSNAQPIYCAGTLATQPGEPFTDKVSDNGTVRSRNVNAFIVDGTAVQGMSGSPVVLMPQMERPRDGEISLSSATQPFLIGIVAATYYFPIGNTGSKGFAGMAFAFAAETIRETIAQFSAG